MLEMVDDNIWIAEGSRVNFYGFAYPTRSVIIRLQDQNLWLWSPIKLTPALKQEIEALGQPAHLVSPNKIHHLFLKEWSEAFPLAKLWGPQSTIKKCPDLEFTAALTDESPPDWREEIEQVWFKGSPVMDEIVFFHHPSRTAILADLSENFSAEFMKRKWAGWQRIIAHIWGIVEGKGYAPLEWRLSFFNRRAVKRARDRLLSFNPEKVIMAHGVWQKENGRAFLEKAFSWMGK